MHTSKFPILVILIFSFLPIFSQTKSQIEEITKNYDKEKISQLAEEFKILSDSNKKKALELAEIYNWPIFYTDENGSSHELMKVSKNNTPIYYKTFNVDAAKSTRANFLHNGGGLGLDIEGQNMTAYVWDEGQARDTHVEFSDASSGPTRTTMGETTGSPINSNHSTHVTGTIIAYGASPNAKGMAPKASAINYNWNTDISEALAASSNGMLISNHSYGPDIAQLPDWVIGAYSFESRQWDLVTHLAPYYLMVCSAGNDGADNSSNGDPLEGNASFDKLYYASTSKNNMVVANGWDLIVDSNGEVVGNPALHYSSSEGPTDDYRVKPDITGNGTNVYSSFASSDTSYSSEYGTSMSSPNVAGSLLLLQQLYNNLNGNFMLSSTLRGLALHYADDGGIVGPDAQFGWGYLNTKKAAECIINDGNTADVEELILNNGDTYIIQVTSDGVNPLLSSICWNDPAGVYNNGTPNDTTPVLVNDLDIRLTQASTTYEPWKLTGVNTNTQGDNIVDNFERIDIPGASGIYELTISHKGTLNSPQAYSLVLSGITDSSIGINEENFTKFNIWPNPTDGLFSISTEGNDSIAVTISDLLGKIVYTEVYSSQSANIKQLDLRFIQNGIYLISVEKNGNKSTRKLIIE